MNHSLFLFIAFSIIKLFISQRNRGRDFTSNDYTNLHVNRTIDLSHLIIKIESHIVIKSMKVDPIYSYRFPLLKNNSKYLVNVAARLKAVSDSDENMHLKISKQHSLIQDEIFDYYEINFKSEPMNYEEERVIIITEEYFERLALLPKKIAIKGDQLVIFSDTVSHVSYYQTNSQNVTVLLPHERTELIEYTKKNAARVRDKLYYTIKSPIASLQFEPLYIHYESNDPIKVLNYAMRTYEVSHWGNIAVEDKYQIENIGALLEGEFGRPDYDDYGKYGGKNAINNLKAKLPIRSWGLWYRDEIGNVSTSRASREWDDVKLILYPRFPILGGWKSNFNIGYNLPSKFHISTDDMNNYMLNLTFGLPYEDMLARNYTMKVVLPEGSTDIKVILPIEAKYTISNENSYGYLDLFGSPTLLIKLKNVYDIHKVNFQVQYKYSQMRLFWKPVLLIIFFFCVFLMLIAYFRVDLSLHSKLKEE